MLVTEAKAQQAADILGVELETLDTDGLGAAYREASKLCHPDSGTNNPEQWARISWAKECLTRWFEKRPKQAPTVMSEGNCRACSGTGRVDVGQRSFGKAVTLMCVMCNGSGTL
jgi:DnaJ-class molecular chaperone